MREHAAWRACGQLGDGSAASEFNWDDERVNREVSDIRPERAIPAPDPDRVTGE